MPSRQAWNDQELQLQIGVAPLHPHPALHTVGIWQLDATCIWLLYDEHATFAIVCFSQREQTATSQPKRASCRAAVHRDTLWQYHWQFDKWYNVIQISADIYIFTSLWLEGFSVNKLCSLDPNDCTTSELHLLRAHNVRLANVEKLWSPKIWTGMNRKIGFTRWNTVLMLLVPFLFVNAWVSKRIQEKEWKGSCNRFTNHQESWLWPSCIQAPLRPPCSSCCSEHVCLNLSWKPETFSDPPHHIAASKGHIGFPLFLRPCAVSRHPCVHLLTSRHARMPERVVKVWRFILAKLQRFQGFPAAVCMSGPNLQTAQLKHDAFHRNPWFHQGTKGGSPVILGSINFSNTAPSSREADQVPLISLASKDHQKPSSLSAMSVPSLVDFWSF